VKQQYIAEDAYKREGTAAVASELSEWIGVGDWTLYVTFPQKIQQVTPADVQRVARQYLTTDQSTTGWFVPVAPAAEKGS
jgi:zinc protease